ncbi:MAG: hypothetical protein ACF8R9_04295 [Phycisphaerales bacterium JB054]
MESMKSSAAVGVRSESEWEDAEVLDEATAGSATPAAASAPGKPDEPDTHGPTDEPGASPEPADEAEWRERAAAAEQQALAMADRLAAVEAAAEDLRRMVGEGERARQIDRELLIAGVVDLDAARTLVEAHASDGATVLEAVSRVRERRPLLFAARGRSGVRATSLPVTEREGDGTLGEVAEAARETGDRRLLLRYLRMRRGRG